LTCQLSTLLSKLPLVISSEPGPSKTNQYNLSFFSSDIDPMQNASSVIKDWPGIS